ncbi:hypothetical protein ASPWEDRAFT_174316 [Aspergillus wentii DTO 134E9]|uniref:Uncharacterized protein n=1 Tax=Aspergillus wentii DTO 134E9 TaxID=1073089 RepID=A0A1L9RD71_ASPWE|nr:uncharacterized protein ASPWEDRAFT_174316 [Aspergillus wentii DTO 134E9]OJJ32880.1 hypothetical protein ASPWEDRAFT_174316 [Aspergillus wentii DTO 134E9]
MLFLQLLLPLLVSAIPQQTPSPTVTGFISITSPPPSSTITPSPSLHCTNGSTVTVTHDCTMGFPVTYCHSPEPPIACPTGSFPSVWHPGHCITASTCYPLDASWIQTKCSNGGIPYTTKTLYAGTLAGGESTVISAVSCSCAQNQWYSQTILPDSNSVDVFCMPSSACPTGMSTSVQTNTYCATASAGACSDIPLTTGFCKCENANATPVYPDGDGAVATGCEL